MRIYCSAAFIVKAAVWLVFIGVVLGMLVSR
jgi:hypothetical protein